MIEFVLRKPKTKLPEVDYVLDNPEDILELVKVLTPKFEGNWSIILLDPKLVLVKDLVDADIIPNHIDCYVYVNTAKMEKLVLDYPKFAPTKKSVKESYKELISNLKHLMDTNAMYELYNIIGPNLSELQEALYKLDAECEEGTITVKQIRKTFHQTKRVYASEVLRSFYARDRYRWNKLNTLVKDLGDSYAYNALYKQATTLLNEKKKYLHNEAIKSRLVELVDAPLICYTYVLFSNSKSYHNLYSIMYAIDHRCEEVLNTFRY